MALREGRTQFSVAIWKEDKERAKALADKNRLTLSRQVEELIISGLEIYEAEKAEVAK